MTDNLGVFPFLLLLLHSSPVFFSLFDLVWFYMPWWWYIVTRTIMIPPFSSHPLVIILISLLRVNQMHFFLLRHLQLIIELDIKINGLLCSIWLVGILHELKWHKTSKQMERGKKTHTHEQEEIDGTLCILDGFGGSGILRIFELASFLLFLIGIIRYTHITFHIRIPFHSLKKFLLCSHH